jgi:hypothetical protein
LDVVFNRQRNRKEERREEERTNLDELGLPVTGELLFKPSQCAINSANHE